MSKVTTILNATMQPKRYAKSAWGQVTTSPCLMRCYQQFVIPRLLRKTANKKNVNVVFLAMNVDMWRYDNVYKLFANDKRFKVVIVTATRSNANMEVRLREEEAMLSYFAARHYEVVRGFDPQTRQFLDLSSLRPDIIFHAQPYDGCCGEIFRWQKFLLALNCYASYSLQSADVPSSWDNPLQNVCWRHYIPASCYLDMCRKRSRVQAKNVMVSGYCLEEEYAAISQDAQTCAAAWRNDSRKRIIWAPHHSIDGVGALRYSSFLLIADYMLQLRDKYANKIIFAFKPHPMLKQKLYKMWGKEKTDDYYAQWDSANSIYAPGDYKALFAGSDAMIHCSSSFCMEYLYANKPVQYVYRPDWSAPDLGEIGDESFKAHYAAHTKDDIEHFISDVVLNGKDTMGDVRKNYVAKYLRAPNGKTFSQNVYDDIVKGLWG